MIPILQILNKQLNGISEPTYKDLLHTARKALRILTHYDHPVRSELEFGKTSLQKN